MALEATSSTSSTSTSSGISFKILLGAIALAFASAAVLSTLLTNLHYGDAARDALLARAVTDAASLSASNIEWTINSTYNDVRSMGKSLLLLGKFFGHSSPLTINASNSSDYLVEPVALQSYSRLYTAALTKIHLTRFNSAGSNHIVTRWADGTGSFSTDSFATDTQRDFTSILSGGAFNFYRSAFGGFYTGVDGFDAHDATVTEHFVWNLTTLEPYPSLPFNELIALRTCVNGVFWNLSQYIEGTRPKPTPWKRIPTYTKLAHIEAMFFGFPVMIYEEDGTTPFVVVTMFLIAPQYADQLRSNLLHADAETSSSFAYLVDRRNGIVLSQAGPEETYESRTFIPGTTHVDRNCFIFAPARSMGCMKNVSTAPEFAPLRALLADSDDIDMALASDHPRLSNADAGGHFVLSTITGEDGIEYYATAETLHLPALVDLKLSLMTFTPRDLFAGKAIEARNVAIGISVVISFIVIVLLEVLLFFIGSAVSELAEQMSDPLHAVALAAAAESDLSQLSTPSIGARVLRVLSNVQELHEVQETFDFCIERIRLLRGFVSKASLEFVNRLGGRDAGASSFPNSNICGDGGDGGDGDGGGGGAPSSGARGGDAGNALSSVESHLETAAEPQQQAQRRHVRFQEKPLISDAVNAPPATPATLPQPNKYGSKARFCCISVSFPFIGRIVEMFAGSGSAAISDCQLLLLDAVGAAAQASSNIVSKAHATSIEELSTVGDEMMCCFRLRTTKVSRTRLLNRVLNECVAASFELQKSIGRRMKRKERRKNLGQQQQQQTQLLSLPLFVAVGAAAGTALSLNHHQPSSGSALSPLSPTPPLGGKEQSSSGSFLLRPVSIVGGAVPLSHLIQRRICAASGTLIFQHDECVLAVRDAPSFSVPRATNLGVGEVLPIYRSEFDLTEGLALRDSPSFTVPWTSSVGAGEMNEVENEQQEEEQQQESTAPPPPLARRTVFSVPFSIGITRDLLEVVNPDFVAVESVASPERCAALLKQDDVQVGDADLLPENVFDDDDAERSVFCRQSLVSQHKVTVKIFRVVPVEMDDVDG